METAEHTKLFLVNLLKERALIEFRRALQIPQQLFLAAIQNLDLQHVAGLALIEHVLQAAPRPLELLKRRMMQDLVQLDREQVIDLRDTRVDHRLGIARHRHLTLQHLADELLHQVLAALASCGIFA